MVSPVPSLTGYGMECRSVYRKGHNYLPCCLPIFSHLHGIRTNWRSIRIERIKIAIYPASWPGYLINVNGKSDTPIPMALQVFRVAISALHKIIPFGPRIDNLNLKICYYLLCWQRLLSTYTLRKSCDRLPKQEKNTPRSWSCAPFPMYFTHSLSRET